MATAVKKITAEEFLKLGLKNAELINGEIEEYMPTKRKHGRIAARIIQVLLEWVDANDSGEVGTEVGLVIRRDPDQVRAPDVYFLRKDRLPNGDGEGFLEVAPDLVVEVLSDSDTLGVIRSKVNDYFAIGTPLVWLVSPEEETVEVRAPDGPRKTLQKGDRLENFPSLPGFSCSVADLFA